MLTSATSAKPTFNADIAGTYVASLVVSDGKVNSATTTVTITATNANAAPVANAGIAQNVSTGTVVTLNGNNSSDANGDALKYYWTLTSKPEGSKADLINWLSVTPTFTADVAGIYVAKLEVHDGKVWSAPSNVTITSSVVINNLVQGAGTFAQEFPSGAFHKINEVSGILSKQTSMCEGFNAADVKPDGKVLAVSTNSSSVKEIDVITGICKELFKVPEAMIGIAIGNDGTVVTISNEKIFGARQIYRFNSSGVQLSKVSANGSSNMTGIGDFTSPSAIDFSSDGKLYATGLNTIWEVNVGTGEGKLRAVGIKATGDIDIDETGVLRTISFGVLYSYALNTWSQINSRVLERDLFGFSALVKR